MIHLFGEDKIRVITYYRHSAEDKQENSNEIQRDQALIFATKEGIEILEHFDDEGFTGLTANRPGFQAMFQKYVIDPNAPKIDYILVYDASRFGRFQRMSEVWHYLGLCEERGIRLATVERGLPKKEMTIMDTFMLTLDFTNAGDYSKRLSEKVFFGCVKVSEQGYSAGGTAPYGYVRVLLSESRDRIGVLKQGEQKMISNQRVSFEPSTNGQEKVVKRIFQEFVDKGYFPDEIAERLNRDKIPTSKLKEWSSSGIFSILSNETYIGTRVYNKSWNRLAQKSRRNPPSLWVRCPNAHRALVSEEMFRKAQERLYWLRPSVRNQAIRQFRSTKSYVWRYLDEVFKSLTDDQRFYVRRNFPVLFGSTYLVGGEKRSCFYVPTETKKFNKLLAVSINNDSENLQVDSIQLVDSDEIGYSSYLILNQSEGRSLLAIDELASATDEICSRVLEQRSPWLMTASATK